MLCEAFSHDGSRAGEGERDPGRAEKFQFLLFTKLSSIEERIKRFRTFFPVDNTESSQPLKNDYEVIIGSSWLHLDVGLSFCGTIIIS